MDINLRLLSERLRRLLAGEEGLLPDAAKAQIQNLYSEIGIVLSWLRDYENEVVSYLVLKISGDIDFTDLEALEKEINYFAYESEKVADTLVMGIVLQESESGSKEIIHDALLPLQSKTIDVKQRMQQVQHMPTEIFDVIKLIQDEAGNSPATSRFKKRDIVGLDDKMEELLDLLIEGPPQLSVVTILDSIGFDKTAFAAEAYDSTYGRKLTCGPYGFAKLKELHLKSMLWLVEWTMGIGAMPKLECLIINPCAYLKMLPEQLWCMKSFKKLDLWWPQVELRQKLRDFEDKEQYDIQIYPLGM